MIRPAVILGLSLCCHTAVQASEDMPPVTRMQGDVEYGEYLASECVTCHAAQSDNYQIPPLTGWDAEHFALMLWEYREKIRVHPAMNTIAARLGDEEIAALAAFFETLED